MAYRPSGRDRERDRDRERYDDRRREREPAREREREYPEPSRGPVLNEFFVNGEGIHREVMQRELCKYLGPDALSRPGVYNGERGYIIKAVRPFTSKMIEDLQRLSQDYEREKQDLTRRGYQDVSYVSSVTRERHDAGDLYDPDPRNYPSQGRYPDAYQERHPDGRMPSGYSGPGNAYPPGSNYPPSQIPGYPPGTYPPGSAYPPGANFPPGTSYPPSVSTYPSSTGYIAPGYTTTSGLPGSRNEPNYIYAEQPGEYSTQGGYPYPPSGGAYSSGAQGREPRSTQNYPYVTSPPDPSMRNIMDDRDFAIYGQQMVSGQPGRGGYPAPSRGTPTGYDQPTQPQARDGGFARGEQTNDRRRR